MRMRSDPADTDVPFFPFPLQKLEATHSYSAINHLMTKPIILDRQAAEVLRLCDGATTLSTIIQRLAESYPDAGGTQIIRPKVIDLLRRLSAKELIWWREIPVKAVPGDVPRVARQ